MASGATFTSVWARCPRHCNLLEPSEQVCKKCKIVERNLSLVPPFSVYCTFGQFNQTITHHTYEVVWVIRDAYNKLGTKKEGYCFELSDGSIVPRIFDPLDFIPLQYLTKDKTDKWLEEELS